MNARSNPGAGGYESAYGEFDSPLKRQLRSEAYGEDIGQHSWVTGDELRSDVVRLRLSIASRLLDIGCGACGPLTYILKSVGCRGTGTELSAAAVAAGRSRAAELGVDHLLTVEQGDLDQPLAFGNHAFDATMALDVLLHVRDRVRLFREVARVLSPAGRFLFTDAGVVTGVISDVEIARRSAHGPTSFCPPGFNERALADAGFRLLETEDRTASMVQNAAGRRAARLSHQLELERLEGREAFERQRQYLETVIDISRRGAVSRFMYLAERAGP